MVIRIKHISVTHKRSYSDCITLHHLNHMIPEERSTLYFC